MFQVLKVLKTLHNNLALTKVSKFTQTLAWLLSYKYFGILKFALRKVLLKIIAIYIP